MATKSEFFPTRITISGQIGLMKRHAHNFKLVSWRCGTVRWQADITPTKVSKSYRIEVTYRLGSHPVVRVLSPKLASAEPRPPHTYRDGSLCLYYPQWDEWSASIAIATHIVPWISLWLFYYEIWLVTGEWLGGGTHDWNSEE